MATSMLMIADGGKQWWVNGKLNRTDGPAVKLADGYTEWWVNYQRRRTDGPAVKLSDGYTEWWVDGKNIERMGRQL